ncbi:hypothetical protein WCE37_10680 [Luteimonas sp. MJ250]|uniref:hypothetical protein n=1 Tax=Luteimonas sp. MJ250 TaxID=3129236 RepID=UPI0031BB0026
MSELATLALAVWAGILVLAFANGALREALLLPLLGKRMAFAASGILLAAIVIWVACLAASWMGLRTGAQAAAVGAGWLLMTIAFECGLGLVQGKAWSELRAAYRFRDGNLWPLVLLATACAPAVALVLRC